MKKVRSQKLVLGKETVARLEASESKIVAGAEIWTLNVSICGSMTCPNEN